ncbi:unnamed protein product [Urochloa decumbens]|uniref:Protein kinase domain-containing protein n=1 Tax=Urochloa decumbens TaxID=240449 RepID=A0ABC9G7K2_9POAL
MAPQPISTTVVIITLVMNTLSTPEPCRMENSFGICGGDLCYGRHARKHLPSFPPVLSFSGCVVMANDTTAPSLLLLLVVSLPGKGNQAACNPASYTDVNRLIPWPSLPLEPGMYGGAPQTQTGELVSSYSFGLNKSLDGVFTSYATSPMLPYVQEPLNYCRPLRGVMDFCCAYNDTGAALFIITGYHNNSRSEASPSGSNRIRYRRRLPRVSPFATHSRKLLSAHDSSTKPNLRRQVLLQEKRVVRFRTAMTGIAVGFALFGLLCATAGLVLWCMRKNSEDEKLFQQVELCPSGPRRYGRRELAAATGGFAEEEKIGRGGFGPVYRGLLLADQERHVAIKVMSSQGSSAQAQGLREFQAEVKVMTRLWHRNIVQLLGWCDSQVELMLVYELVPNGSLDKHLYDPERTLTWSDRFKIAHGVGSAILYLHTECEPCVLHGDIKPANILLDHSGNAKLGDFGLARLVDHDTDSYTTQVVVGTPGYMDPEFVNSQRPCAESDIFSFGVVLLEIACGRRPTTRSNGTPVLLNWVRDMYSKNSILAVADRRLDGEFDDQQMRRVLVAGLWCAHHDQSHRPSIAQAMDLLRREDAELPLLVDVVVDSQDAVVRSLEEIAYGVLSAEDSASENSSTDTAYHTSTDSSSLLE